MNKDKNFGNFYDDFIFLNLPQAEAFFDSVQQISFQLSGLLTNDKTKVKLARTEQLRPKVVNADRALCRRAP